jgi:hypothetical protein
MSQRVDCHRLLKATGSFRKPDANKAWGAGPKRLSKSPILL